jgi:hypothetical protein
MAPPPSSGSQLFPSACAEAAIVRLPEGDAARFDLAVRVEAEAAGTVRRVRLSCRAPDLAPRFDEEAVDAAGVTPAPNNGGLEGTLCSPEVSPRALAIGSTYCLPAGEPGST